MKAFGLVVLAIYLPVVGGLEQNARGAVAKGNPTVNKSHWSAVSLPVRPFNITAVGDRFWVCGLDESIAVSRDGGSTWQVKHKTENGDVLLKIEFVDEKTAHAAGTGGLLLATTDGGETWSSHRAGGTIQDFSFSSADDGIAEIDGRIKLTSDGGEHWRELNVMHEDPKVRPFTEIESIASLDAAHFAVALHQDQGENIFLSTVDGGTTWVPTHVVNTFAGRLFTRDGEYWAFGIEYLGREHDPAGGYSAPVALHSSDARVWEHGPRATTEFDACTEQGCSLRYGVVEILYGKGEKIFSLPQNRTLTNKWSFVGDKACMVDGGLWCGSALASDAPQPMPVSEKPIQMQAGRNVPFVNGCLDCRLDSVSFDPSLGSRPTIISGFAKVEVRADGSVNDVTISGIPSAVIKKEMESQMSHWIVAPGHKGLGTVASERSFELKVLCFPGFPGHPETAGCHVESGRNF